MRRIRKWFFAGLALTLPTAVTVWVLWKLFVNVDAMLQPLVERYLGFRIPGLGIIAVLLLLVLVGMLASSLIVRRLIRYFEGLAGRLPLAGRIYTSVRQILDVLLSEKTETFRNVVLLQYPRPGLWAMGFVSRRTPPALQPTGSDEPHFNVFLPTSPNPTSGFMLIVPESDLLPVGLSVEEAFKVIVSGGAYISPEVENVPLQPKSDAKESL